MDHSLLSPIASAPLGDGAVSAVSTPHVDSSQQPCGSSSEVWLTQQLDEVMKSTRSILSQEFHWDAKMPDNPDENGNYPVPIPGVTSVM